MSYISNFLKFFYVAFLIYAINFFVYENFHVDFHSFKINKVNLVIIFLINFYLIIYLNSITHLSNYLYNTYKNKTISYLCNLNDMVMNFCFMLLSLLFIHDLLLNNMSYLDFFSRLGIFIFLTILILYSEMILIYIVLLFVLVSANSMVLNYNFTYEISANYLDISLLIFAVFPVVLNLPFRLNTSLWYTMIMSVIFVGCIYFVSVVSFIYPFILMYFIVFWTSVINMKKFFSFLQYVIFILVFVFVYSLVYLGFAVKFFKYTFFISIILYKTLFVVPFLMTVLFKFKTSEGVYLSSILVMIAAISVLFILDQIVLIYLAPVAMFFLMFGVYLVFDTHNAFRRVM